MCAQKDFTVCIVGGGIVGLVCAIGLGQAGIQVDVFEAASKYDDIGAGIGVGPNAMHALENMSLLENIMGHSNDGGRVMRLFRFTNGAEPHNIIYEYPRNKNGHMGLGLHRATFLRALADLLPTDGTVRSHFKKRCVSVSRQTETGRTVVRFADGTEHEADILVGADGIKSCIREQVFGTSGDRLVDTGTKAYRALVPMQRLMDAGVEEELLRPWPRCWLGVDKHFITFPIQDNTVLNIVAFSTDFSHQMTPAGSRSNWSSWVQPAPQEELLKEFEEFGDRVKKMLKCMDEPNRWRIHGLYPPLESFVSLTDAGNVALIGDAAHAMLPHLGAGAGTGIEDAFVLARLLALPQTRRANLPQVLQAYDAVRVPRATFIANASKRTGDMYEGHGPSGPSDAGRRKDLDLLWEPIWQHDVLNDVAKAIETLETNGVFKRAELTKL